ncbi:MAG: DUF177 domain-containing protein [Eggerthellaceae bacterium]|nr:DUF177 domain-containing protein [Eggerthellaceae bacterium]
MPAELFALAESSHFEGQADIPLIEAGPDDLRFDAPISYALDITNTGEALLVQGSASGVATVACARCLEDVRYELDGQIDGYILLDEPDYDEDDDSFEFEVLSPDHIIDLEPLVCAALIMDAPLVPLCREDCAGLCPTCGANLNEGPCGCGPDEALADFERAANPFSALADFKFE